MSKNLAVILAGAPKVSVMTGFITGFIVGRLMKARDYISANTVETLYHAEEQK